MTLVSGSAQGLVQARQLRLAAEEIRAGDGQPADGNVIGRHGGRFFRLGVPGGLYRGADLDADLTGLFVFTFEISEQADTGPGEGAQEPRGHKYHHHSDRRGRT
jgi:hypothetical protein